MKNFKVFTMATIMLCAPIHSIDLPKCGESMQQGLSSFGHNLMTDTTTQFASVGSVAAGVVAYHYYYYNAALACLDEHPNSRIMHKANLIYLPYSAFLEKIESIDSYAETLEFINQYCTSYYTISDTKINKFIALTNDLQRNNCKRLNDTLEQENIILENFKNNLILAQENIKEELINSAINANKNANNAIAIRNVLNIIQILADAFSSK